MSGPRMHDDLNERLAHRLGVSKSRRPEARADADERGEAQAVERWLATPEAERRLAALRKVADIMARHTHQGIWAMSRFAGTDPENDCHLCRALVAAGVLTLDQIGEGTAAALRENPDAE